jgi:hypothetical protein
MTPTGLYVFSDWFSKVTGYILGDDQKVRLMECLDKKNTALYTADRCTECFEQQQLIGEKAYSLLKVISCDKAQCNFEALPIWEIAGSFYPGKKTLEELATISGCPFETS